MVQTNGIPLDLNVGDIVIEKHNGYNVLGGDPPVEIRYWVITKVTENDNPIRWGHTFEKFYSAFNLRDDTQHLENVVFRNDANWNYEVIRG